MEKGFFRSKEFVVGAAIGLVLITGAVVATSSIDDVNVRIERGCTVDVIGQRTLDARIDDTGARRSGDGAERVVTFTADAAGLQGGRLQLCTDVGDIEVTNSPDDTVRATFTIVHRGSRAFDAVDGTEVEAVFTNDGGRLDVAAFQPNRAQVRGLFDSRSTSVRLQLEVPDGASYDLDARTDVGDIVLTLVDLRSLDATTDVGDIEAAGITIADDVDARTDVGDITLVINDVGSGSWRLRTDVGGVELRIPLGSDVGYDVHIETDVGSASAEIGTTEHESHENHGPSHELHARSEGFASKAKQVVIRIQTDVGNAAVTTTGATT